MVAAIVALAVCWLVGLIPVFFAGGIASVLRRL